MQLGIVLGAKVGGGVMFLCCLIKFPKETGHSTHDSSSILLAIRNSCRFNFKQN